MINKIFCFNKVNGFCKCIFETFIIIVTKHEYYDIFIGFVFDIMP